MGNILTDRLALIIDAQTGGAVTEIRKAAKASDEQATAQERAALASANLTKSTDALALSQAKLTLAQAKEAGDDAALATAQNAVAAATQKASVSKAEAAVASNNLSVANARAAASAAELGTAGAASGGLLASMGIKGGSALEIITAGLTKVGPLIALVLGAKLLEDGIKHFTQLGDTIRSFQLVTGASASQASELVGQLQALGVDPDIAAKGLARLGAAIGDGSTKLGQYGIEIAHNADGATNLAATFENLRKAYNASTDAATRDAIAKQVGLRGAEQLAPLLALDTQQIKELNAATKARGEIFSQSDITAAHDLSIAQNELKLSFQGLEISLARGVVPALVSFVSGASKAVDLATRLANNSVFKTFLSALIPGLSEGATLLRLFTGGTNDAAAAAQKAAAAFQVEQADIDKLTTALVSEYDAQKAVADTAQSVADAKQNVVTAQKTLDDLTKKGAVDAAAVAAAQKELASASEEVTKAEESEARAQDTLNKAREKASALDLAEAQNKIALAGDKIGDANAKVQQAKESYDKLLGSGSASAGELAAAAAAVKTAQDDATQSVLDQQQANVDLQTVKKKGTEQDPAVISAEQAVADAHRSVTDAIGRRSDAEGKLRQAETPDPNFQASVAKATNDVARAHQAVADAQENQVVAALKLGPAQAAAAAAINADGQALGSVRSELETLNGEGLNANSLLGLLPAVAISTNGGGFLANYFGALAGLSTLSPSATAPKGSLGAYFGGLSGRAGGGPVSAYKDYIVGEKGPEILRMGSSGGSIQPNPGKATVVTYAPTYQITGGAGTSQLAQEITRRASRDLRTTVLPYMNGRQ